VCKNVILLYFVVAELAVINTAREPIVPHATACLQIKKQFNVTQYISKYSTVVPIWAHSTVNALEVCFF